MKVFQWKICKIGAIKSTDEGVGVDLSVKWQLQHGGWHPEQPALPEESRLWNVEVMKEHCDVTLCHMSCHGITFYFDINYLTTGV